MMTVTAPTLTSGERRYLADARAPRDARRHARAWLLQWGLRGLSDTTELIASELVTNAVVHGGGADVGLELVCTARSVILMATDASPRVPVVNDAEDHDEHGRGLAMVAALCGRWGWYFTDAGRKVVWGEVFRGDRDMPGLPETQGHRRVPAGIAAARRGVACQVAS